MQRSRSRLKVPKPAPNGGWMAQQDRLFDAATFNGNEAFQDDKGASEEMSPYPESPGLLPPPDSKPGRMPPVPQVYEQHKQPALIVDLEDQLFVGPTSSTEKKTTTPYASLSVLEPCLTIERHDGKLHIAARFNIETTILRYHSKKHDGNELFFHDILLQYLKNPTVSPKENFAMWPESDPSRSFAVTRSTNSEVSGDIGLSGSGTPSGDVSLGLSRSTELTVEYSIGSWCVSAHRVVNSEQAGKGTSSPPRRPRNIRGPSFSDSPGDPQYQWYWAGTQDETRHLTADVKHTVKRHVVAKRIVDWSDILSPVHIQRIAQHERRSTRSDLHRERRKSRRLSTKGNLTSMLTRGLPFAQKETDVHDDMILVHSKGLPVLIPSTLLHMLLKQLLTFSFHAEVRVKRRYGRLHRLMLLSGNNVKAKFLSPVYQLDFALLAPDEVVKSLIDEGCYTGRSIRIQQPPTHSIPSNAPHVAEEQHLSVDDSDEKNVENRRRPGRTDSAIGKATVGDNDVGESEKPQSTEERQEEHVEGRKESPVLAGEEPADNTPGVELEPGRDQQTTRPSHSLQIPGVDGLLSARSFTLPLYETIDLSDMMDRLKYQNTGRWDRLQGRSLNAELGRAGVISLPELRRAREAHEVRIKEMRERIRQMEEAEREAREHRQELHRQMHQEPRMSRSPTFNMERSIPRPHWKRATFTQEPDLGRPQFARHFPQGGDLPRPGPARLGNGNDNEDDGDSGKKDKEGD